MGSLVKGTGCIDFFLLPDQESAVCHFAFVSPVGEELEPSTRTTSSGSVLLTAVPLPCLSHMNLLSNFPLYTNPCQESSERYYREAFIPGKSVLPPSPTGKFI